MEKNDVHLIIGKRHVNKEYFPLTIETVNGGKHIVKLTAVSFPKDINTPYIPEFLHFISLLWNTMNEENLIYLIDDLHSLNQNDEPGRILLELRAPELLQLPWEKMLDFSPFSYLKYSFKILRYLSKTSSFISSPLYLPLDVLIFSETENEANNNLPTNDSLKYFRATKVTGASADHLKSLLKNSMFDIVQLTCRAVFDKQKKLVLFPGAGEMEIDAKDLRALLSRCKARLLILQCMDDNYGALLVFAHQLHMANGPTVWVTPRFNNARVNYYNELYFGIIHNESLVNIFPYSKATGASYFDWFPFEPALFIGKGGGDVLKISSVESRLSTQVNRQLKKAKDLRESILLEKSHLENVGDAFKLQAIDEKLRFLDESIENDLEILLPNKLDYHHESGGMEPLTDIEKITNKIDKQLDQIENRVKRVVNSYFWHNERLLDPKENLLPDTEYLYDLQIGVASDKSHVQNAVAIPEEELKRHYSDEGYIDLQVELFSKDLDIQDASQTFKLPRPPAETDWPFFIIKTPGKSCVARMRASIYYKKNLIQSLIVTAVVGEPKTKTKIKGNSAVVDYALTSSFENIERLPERSLNIAINDDGNGTHSFYIAGTGLRRQFDYGAYQLSSTIAKTRAILMNICAEKKRGKLKYRYGDSNSNSKKKFVEDIKKLAEQGANLYSSILTNQDWEFEKKLRDSLDKAEKVIQISSTKSANYIFPWAIVYDKPLDYGETSVCDKFLADLEKGDDPGYLRNQTCILEGCKHKTDKKIVCPSGFWGIRHIIEQPLSTYSSFGGNDSPREINVRNGTNLMMGVSDELNGCEDHEIELKKLLVDADIQLMKNKEPILKGLQEGKFHLVYFYCHGGRDDTDTWLKFSNSDKIVPREIRFPWQEVRPFVFINGCHTADIAPNDLLHFNNQFAYSNAWGVMGTEISIPEELARPFASGFLGKFFAGTNVGDSVRQQRLELLEGYNLLGLVYTPYCSGDLKIVN